MPPSRAVGIDLGTTSAALSRIDDTGRSAMIRDPQGDLLIPNIVFFDDDELVFGRAAKQAAVTQPGRAGESVKRDRGQAVYSRAIGGELLPPELIEGCLLKHACADLSRGGGPKPAVVLSVPASSDQAQRKALLDAGQIAGLDVLGTINDPLASALAFAENQGYLSRGADKPGCRVLLFDLGGGKLDAAIVEIKPGRLRTMAVAGDARLGGRDWDARLSEQLAGEFSKQFGEDPRHDMVSVRRLLESAEEAKHALTARQQARVHLERGAHTADITITRQTFEEITLELLGRAKCIAEKVLAQSGLAWRDFAHLLLVGGATRMPMIGKMLETLTGLKPAPNIHPDEAVARGAALYADWLLAAREGRKSRIPLEVADLTCNSLGVEWVDPASGRAENVVLIPRGTELPCGTVSKLTTTADGQTSVTVQLLEGESRNADDCSRIGQAEFRDLPLGLPKGWPIEVQYQYTAAGRLQVKAHIEKSGQITALPARRECGMPESQVADWRKLLSGRVGLTAILDLLGRHRKRHAESAVSAPPQIAATAQPPALPLEVRDEVVSWDALDVPSTSRPRNRTLSPRKIAIMLTGYLLSAALGLAIGYYILMRMDPSYNWLQLRLPGLSRPAPNNPSVSKEGY
jgi:molecular chaperone DnaK